MKKQSEEIEQHQSDSHMAEMFELSGWEFKITVINILRVLMETVNNMQEQMGDVSKEMETKGKKSKENARNNKCCNRNKNKNKYF